MSNRAIWPQAIADFNEAIVLTPDSPEIFYQRGLAFARQKNYQYAIEDYNQALLLRPQDSEIIYQKAMAYAGVGSVDRSH